MFGGGGADRFVFAAGHGDDLIRDFDPAADILELTGLAPDAGALTLTAREDGMLVTTPGGTILLEGVAEGALLVDDFVF